MEPLGAAASIITLLQLTHKLSILCLDVHSRMKTATPDILRLVDEIKSLRSLFEGLVDLASTGNAQQAASLQHLGALAQADGALTKCKTELRSLESWLQAELKSATQSKVGAIKWTLKQKDVVRRYENIFRIRSTLQLALAIDQTRILLESHSDLLSLKRDFEDGNLEQRRQSIIDWLAVSCRSSNLKDAQNARSPSTGDWFLRSTRFQNWKRLPRSIFWLHGIPGSGKTILCSSIVDILVDKTSYGNQPVTLYFMFDFNTRDGQALSRFLRSLLVQVQSCHQLILEPIQSLRARCNTRFDEPSDKELLDAVKLVLAECAQTYIIIDAIDECASRERLLETIEEINQWGYDHLHLLVASRKEPDIEEVFTRISTQQCQMDAVMVNVDIRRHVKRSIGTDSRLGKWSPEVQDEIVTTLTSRAGGMFRWADCQLRAIRKARTRKALRDTLASLPATLDDTYARVLDGVDSDIAPDAHKMLLWLCFTAYPLTINQMTDILAVNLKDLTYDDAQRIEDAGDLLSICGSLVTCSGGVIRLSHYTVKEYLMSERILDSHQANYSVSETIAQTLIAKTCLVYLQQHERSRRDGQAPPLLAYSVDCWSRHYNAAGRTRELTTLMLSLLDDPESIFYDLPRAPRTLPNADNEPRKGVQTLFYYAALVQCPPLLEAVLDRGANIDAVGGHYGTALTASAYKGCRESVELLLTRGADPNIQAGNYSSALHAATTEGRLEIMNLLVFHGADVNAMRGSYETALIIAVQAEHRVHHITKVSVRAEDLVKVLLEAGADPRVGNRRTTALSYAAARGDPNVLKLLLDYGADPNEQDGLPLQYALCYDHPVCVELLISKGADVDRRGGAFGCPVFAAALGEADMLRFLIENLGADYSYVDEEGRTALHVAACGHDSEAVEYLLELGVDINQQDMKGWSALHYAASARLPYNMQTLLAHPDFSVPAHTSGWSPLHLACRRNTPGSLDLLLRAGIQSTTVTTTDPDRQWTLYDIAVQYGNHKLLTDNGAPKHRLLEEAARDTGEYCGLLPYDVVPSWCCDGCCVGFDRFVYGPRFKCTVCPDFDYCFMCQLTADQTHPHPMVEVDDGASLDGAPLAVVGRENEPEQHSEPSTATRSRSADTLVLDTLRIDA